MAQARNQVSALAAQATTAVGTQVDVSGYQFVQVPIFCADGTATVKIRGCLLSGVALGSAAAVANPWDYVACYDLEDMVLLAGDTGVSLTSGDCRNLYINCAGLWAVALEVTAVSGGKVTAWVITYDNE